MTDPFALWIQGRVSATPNGVAIRTAEATWTWERLAIESGKAAAALDAAGVRRGDVVAAHLAPQPSVVVLLHAAQALGATLLPLNLRLAPPERARILAHSRARVLVADESVGELPGDTRMRILDAATDLAPAAEKKSLALPTRIDPLAVLALVYTSGTSSEPKGVLLTNRNFAASAKASARRLGHGAGDAWLATLPFFHVGGLAMLARSALEGSRVLLEPGFDVERVRSVFASGDATMVSLVPTMLARVLDGPRGDVSPRLRCVLVGGAALSPSLGRRALDAGLPVAASYGMTEACSQIATSEPGSDDAARGLVGRPLAGVNVRIANPGTDGRGEIEVRGLGIMKGYLGGARPAAGGWLRTGDIGRLDEEGRLSVDCRRDDLIVTGGENVSPIEVEQVLDEHPDVLGSLVGGVEDDEWGQRIVATVVLREGRQPDAAALEAWCRGRIASYKVPRELRFVDALPRTETGKLRRRAV